MKKLLSIFIMVCLSFLILGQTNAKTMTDREILLQSEHDKADLRSLSSIHAYLDGQTVYISFYDQPKAVSVVITDIEEKIIVANTYSSPQGVSIPVCEIGKYQIEIHVDFKVYTGVFELE